MKNSSPKDNRISRRSFLPIIGSSLLLPLLGFGNDNTINTKINQEEGTQSLLKPDGTLVKVNLSTLKKAKVIKKNISNKTFLSWLGKTS